MTAAYSGDWQESGVRAGFRAARRRSFRHLQSAVKDSIMARAEHGIDGGGTRWNARQFRQDRLRRASHGRPCMGIVVDDQCLQILWNDRPGPQPIRPPMHLEQTMSPPPFAVSWAERSALYRFYDEVGPAGDERQPLFALPSKVRRGAGVDHHPRGSARISARRSSASTSRRWRLWARPMSSGCCSTPESSGIAARSLRPSTMPKRALEIVNASSARSARLYLADSSRSR